MPHKRSKGSVLYLHAPKACYDCAHCVFLQGRDRCLIHGPADEIRPEASCGYFIEGDADTFSGPPLSLVTKGESGYTNNVGGASCKRCEYWNPEGKCLLVDENSPGDDPGCIDGDACCVLWEPR